MCVIVDICCKILSTTSRMRCVVSGLGKGYFQFCIFKNEYPSDRISAAIIDTLMIRCDFHSRHAAKYVERHLVFSTSTLSWVKTSVVPILHIQSWIFIWTYLRCYCWYVDNSMRFSLRTGCEICGATSCLRCVISVLVQDQSIYNFAYSSMNIRLNVSPLLLLLCW